MIVSLFETLEYAPETSDHLIDTEQIVTDEVPSSIEDRLSDREKEQFLEDLEEAKRLLEESEDHIGWGHGEGYPKFEGNDEIEGNHRFVTLVEDASTSYPANVEKSLTLYQQ